MAIASCADAQKLKETEVPAVVTATFQKLYPGVTAKWEKEDGNYEAGFENKQGETSVLINDKGALLETENEIAVSALPKAATDYITKNKPGEKVKEAAMIIDSAGKKMYEAEVKDGDLLFDETGNFIKEEKGEGKEDKD